jgi:hypothetical protein
MRSESTRHAGWLGPFRLVPRGVAIVAAIALLGSSHFRLTPALFLILIAVEFALLDLTISAPPPVSRITRLLLFVVPVVLALGLRVARAFSTTGLLDWDETYYMSMAVTAAGGRGLYPYIYGYPPMLAMGGYGYGVYVYALAVKLFGSTVLALRGAAFVASVLGLAGMWALVKSWYGSGTAWMTAALTSSLTLFVMSNSVRLDVWTFAYVAWALVVMAHALRRWDHPRGHVLAGLMFGLGLQVHIDTIVTAMACGALYLVLYLRDARAAGKLVLLRHPMCLFLSGIAAGGLLYVCLNILPDPASYYRTTALVRVDATSWYSHGTSSLTGSFLNPRILLAKESGRYRQLAALTPVVELGLVAAAMLAMAWRRNASDRLLLVLVPAVLLAAAVVLNTSSPMYFIHVLPILIVPLAAVFTHGLSGRSLVPFGEVSPRSLVPFLGVLCAVTAVTGGQTIKQLKAAPAPSLVSPAEVRQVRSLVDPRCRLAGDAGLYVQFFADYPYYVSLRDTEMRYGMLYYGIADEAAYWQVKQPDAVFDQGRLRPGLLAYVTTNHLTEAAPGLWIRPGGCRGGP